jgi:hypothetical protein
MTISNVKFNSPDINSMITGNIFFSNDYGISLLTPIDMSSYRLTFYIKKEVGKWLSSMDDNLLAISPNNHLENLTQEQVNDYIGQVENLPNK